jgi:hypothetical protein
MSENVLRSSLDTGESEKQNINGCKILRRAFVEY